LFCSPDKKQFSHHHGFLPKPAPLSFGFPANIHKKPFILVGVVFPGLEATLSVNTIIFLYAGQYVITVIVRSLTRMVGSSSRMPGLDLNSDKLHLDFFEYLFYNIGVFIQERLCNNPTA